MNLAEQGINAKGVDVCLEKKRNVVRMRETRIKHIMQIELANRMLYMRS